MNASPLRVLMVSDVYFPRVNGVSTAIETYRRNLAALGVQVELLAPDYGDNAHQNGITRVRARRVPFDPEDRLMHWRRLRRTAIRLARYTDLVHIHTPFAAHYAGVAAARCYGLPVVSSYHTLFEEYLELYAPMVPSAWLRGFARTLARRQCRALTATIVPSCAMAERLAAYGVRDGVSVLPTGVPTAQFRIADRATRREQFRQRLGIDPDTPVALFVGRAAHEKNIGFLIESLVIARKRAPSLMLLIAGEGPALTSLRELARKTGQSEVVRFLGYLDRDRDLPDCYAAADLFAFASRTETQGLALIEAMAAGLPVVALAEMGTRDLLSANRGAMVTNDDTSAFARALADLALDVDARRLLGEEATALAEKWSDVALTGRLAQLYHSLASQPRRGFNSWKALSKARQA
ncbi:MAG: glycosyltransferase [Chromatiales bacterium]|nr:glycosyltransferase [Chromatiales bacterium]